MAAVDRLVFNSGLSQAEIARRLGITYQAIQAKRRGRRPSALWVARLVEILGGKLVIEFPPSASLANLPK